MTLKEKAKFLMKLEVRTDKVFKKDESIDEMMDSLFYLLDEFTEDEIKNRNLENDINKCYKFYNDNK
jgi:hypothetical protein